MIVEKKEDLQTPIDESKKEEISDAEKLYPNKTQEEKEARETKESDTKESEEKLAKEKEEKETDDKLKKEEGEKKEGKKEEKKEKEIPSITELQDAAQAAIEKWQADPTPENKKLADKAVDDSKKSVDDAKKAEIKYDVKTPENSLLSPERIEEIVEYARERGFSNDMAQALTDREHQTVEQVRTQALDNHEELVSKEWPKLAKEDKEIGGDDFSKNAELAKRVLNKYGSPEFNKLLEPKSKDNPEGTGYGNHPELLRVFVRLGKVMSDDTLTLGGSKGGEKKSVAELFYGEKTKKAS